MAALAAAGALVLAACGTGSGGPGGSSDTLTEIDYYDAAPQNTQLPAILDECGNQVGVKVKHQQVPRAQFLPKLLQQASARSLPDLALVDNPDLQQLAATGGLVSLSKAGLSTTGLYPSIVQAGQYQGQTYGIAPGVNGLALYYNTDVFTRAGLQPPKTWDSTTRCGTPRSARSAASSRPRRSSAPPTAATTTAGLTASSARPRPTTPCRTW
jgi:multiple sugar transport system substrate-binding protein